VKSLPYIDEHRLEVRATPERTWDAVVQFVQDRLTRPAPVSFVQLWRLSPASGFAIAEKIAPRHLALRGQHRFSRYELAFDIAPRSGSVVLTARTAAEFPGISGSLYRALVIGSGGHGIIVRQMLRRIAKSAERAG
jgi:hypothetical protein